MDPAPKLLFIYAVAQIVNFIMYTGKWYPIQVENKKTMYLGSTISSFGRVPDY